LLADEQLLQVPGTDTYYLNSAGTTVWTLTDNENTVRDLATYSNGTTTVQNHREFSAYGELLSQTNPQTGQAAAVDCVFAYTGRALDEATGLQNNDERWYEAITGRWLSQDPIRFRGRDVNLYRYCGDSPTNFTDPTGEDRRKVTHWWHGIIEVQDPNCPGKVLWLEFSPSGYTIGPPDARALILGPWTPSTPAQDQELINFWRQLERDRGAGKRWDWFLLNNCWIPVTFYYDVGIPWNFDCPGHGFPGPNGQPVLR
jgi:RHS repeat-associated protein